MRFDETHIYKETQKLIENLTLEDCHLMTCFSDVCCDFDGVIHMYTSGWQGADNIPDDVVPGAIQMLYHYLGEDLSVAIHSARSAQKGGIDAMKMFINKHDLEYRQNLNIEDLRAMGALLTGRLYFPIFKPASTVYLDDRGCFFRGPGKYPVPQQIREFKPWNHKSNFMGYLVDNQPKGED